MKVGKIVEIMALAAILIMQIFSIYKILELSEKLESSRPFQTNQQFQPSVPLDWQIDCEKDLNGYDAVFIYLPTCPHCQRMEPLVKSSDLKFYWINVGNPQCSSLNLTEFNFQGFVPHFYCLKNGNSHIGEMPEEQFRNWTKSCK